MGRGVANDRFTGRGMIQPGANAGKYQSKRKPDTKTTPRGAGVGRDPNAEIKAEIEKRKEQNAALRGAKIMRKRTGK